MSNKTLYTLSVVMLCLLGGISNIYAGEVATNTLSVSSKMNSDYSNFMKTYKEGDVIDWANGKLTRTASGARFIDSLGMIAIMPESNPDFNLLAKENPEIAKMWLNQYGFVPASKENQNTNSAAPIRIAPTSSQSVSAQDNLEYIAQAKESTLQMVAAAAKKYKEGAITQEQFMELGQQASKMSNYSDSVLGEISLAAIGTLNTDTKKFKAGTLSLNNYVNSLLLISEKLETGAPVVKLVSAPVATGAIVKIPFKDNLDPDIKNAITIDQSAKELKYYPSDLQLGSPSLFQFDGIFYLTNQTYGTAGVSTSIDGVNWTKRTVVDPNGRPLYVKNLIKSGNTVSGLGQQINGIYGQNLINNTKTYWVTTLDGKKWTTKETNIPVVTSVPQSDGAIFLKNSMEVAWNGEKFVTVQPDVNGEQIVYTSTNGVDWNSRGALPKSETTKAPFTTFIQNLGKNFVVTYGQGGESINTWVSSDGVNWKAYSTKAEYFGVMNTKVVNNTLFILANNYGTLMKSQDGIKWSFVKLGADNVQIVPPSVPYKLISDFASYQNGTKAGDVQDWAGGKLSRMVDRAKYVSPQGNEVIIPLWHSYNDSDYNSVANSDPNIASLWLKDYGYKSTTVATATPKAMAMRDIGYNGSFYLIVTSEINSAYKSTDGINWNLTSLPISHVENKWKEPVGTAWSSIATQGKQFVVTGFSGGSSIRIPGFATNATVKSNSQEALLAKQKNDYAQICGPNPNYPICASTDAERIAALRSMIANTTVPLTMSQLGPGFEGSDIVFNEDLVSNRRTFVPSCQEAAEKYGLFGGKKNSPGVWKNEQAFYDLDGKFIGIGGALLSEHNYTDRVTGVIKIAPDISYSKVGNCQFEGK